jgi:Uma2 family endonuclease
MSLEQYLVLDRSSDERWEYVNGEVVPVAASPEHNVVKLNLLLALGRALDGLPCFPLPDGQKVATVRTGAYHYPDASVWCGPPVRDAADDHAFSNPTVLFEVLSPSTEDYDRGGKFRHYRTLASLQEYVVISLQPRTVERHRRLPTGEWLLTEVTEGGLELRSIGITLDVATFWSDMDRVAPPTR